MKRLRFSQSYATDQILDSVNDAFCASCGQQLSEEVEPDRRNIWCPDCQTATGFSSTELLMRGLATIHDQEGSREH